MNTAATDFLFEYELPYPRSSTELFQRIRHFPLPVLLASGAGNSGDGDFDILTAAPAKIISTRGAETRVETQTGSVEKYNGNPIDVLKQQFDYPQLNLALPPHFPFAGGMVGYFAYDLLHPHLQGGASAADIPLPDMQTGLYHWAVVINHRRSSCHFLALPGCPETFREELLHCLETPVREGQRQAFALTGDFCSNFSRQEYEQAYQRVIDYIHAGDCYQVNLAQRFSSGFKGDPFCAFEKLHGLANAPFSAYLESELGSVLSFSPERFIKVRDGRVLTQPIKGTRPRNVDSLLDDELLKQLRESGKDQAENLMIVDLLRNDLGRVCRTGSIRVPSLFDARSFRNVHHLVSTIEGTLEKRTDVFELLKSCFPGGSVTGTPKIRAMEIIDELETRPRSVYCGSVGYIGFDGSMDSNICIRTLVCADSKIHCWGGGGIVSDSRPEQEYQETLDKISLFINNIS